MTYYEFQSQYASSIEALSDMLLNECGIQTKTDYQGRPAAGPSMVNGQDGLYLKLPYDLSSAQVQALNSFSPLTVFNLDGTEAVTFTFNSYSESDHDDDRTWDATVSFYPTKDAQPLISF